MKFCLLEIWGDQEIQKQFEGSTRNKIIFEDISARLAERDVVRSADQCREKIKKLRGEYGQIQNHSNVSGRNRKTIRFLPQLDAILGHIRSSRASSRATLLLNRKKLKINIFNNLQLSVLFIGVSRFFMQNIISFVDTEYISDTPATPSASSVTTIALTPDDTSVHVVQSQASSLTEVSHSEPGTLAGSVVSNTPVRKGKKKRKRVDCEDDDSDNIIF